MAPSLYPLHGSETKDIVMGLNSLDIVATKLLMEVIEGNVNPTVKGGSLVSHSGGPCWYIYNKKQNGETYDDPLLLIERLYETK